MVTQVEQTADAANGALAGFAAGQPETLALAMTHLSPWELFFEADIIVQGVMLLLLLASVFSWAVMAEKWRTVRAARTAADRFEDMFWSGGPLDKLVEAEKKDKKNTHPMGRVFTAAMTEWRRSTSGAGQGRGGAAQRLATIMRVAADREMDTLEHRLGFLATVGSVAPFVGLFGTVWGIMRAFIGIAATQNTTLAVVAPGIAEALMATAIGLVAAIPAVVGFNKLQADVARFETRLLAFSDEFHALMTRQLDEREAA